MVVQLIVTSYLYHANGHEFESKIPENLQDPKTKSLNIYETETNQISVTGE